jgi:hypothetical protein
MRTRPAYQRGLLPQRSSTSNVLVTEAAIIEADWVTLFRVSFVLRGFQHLSFNAWLLGDAFPDNRYTSGPVAVVSAKSPSGPSGTIIALI